MQIVNKNGSNTDPSGTPLIDGNNDSQSVKTLIVSEYYTSLYKIVSCKQLEWCWVAAICIRRNANGGHIALCILVLIR